MFNFIRPILKTSGKCFIITIVFMGIHIYTYVCIFSTTLTFVKGGNKRSFEIGYFVLKFAS